MTAIEKESITIITAVVKHSLSQNKKKLINSWNENLIEGVS